MRAVEDLDETIKIIRSTIFGLRTHDEAAGPGLRARAVRVVGETAPVMGFAPSLRMEGLLDTHVPKEIADRGGPPDSDDVELDIERNLADSGHSTAERTQAIAVVKALRANLRWVDRALDKIDRDAYGTCESCGRPISPERLEALPWAILCIACKQAGGRR